MPVEQHDYKLPCAGKAGSSHSERWSELLVLLGDGECCDSFEAFHSALVHIAVLTQTKYRVAPDHRFHGLEEAMRRAEGDVDEGKMVFYGPDGLLLRIHAAVRSIPVLFNEAGGIIPTLRAGEGGSVTFTPLQARGVLGAAFFLCLHSLDSTGEEFGDIAISSIYGQTGEVAVARVRSLLGYFHRAFWTPSGYEPAKDVLAGRHGHGTPIWWHPDGCRSIVFTRAVLGADEHVDWSKCSAKLSGVDIRVSHTLKIEDHADSCHVDFANRRLHIHRVIASATQEEVLFSLRPELFLSLMFVQAMRDDEVVHVLGAVRTCSYTGYLDTFRYKPLSSLDGGELCPMTMSPAPILALDAVFNINDKEYELPNLLRDLHKAYKGFTMKGTGHVSTGNWGCGVFNGDVQLKFMQQWMAAAVAGVDRLSYSTFGRPDTARALQEIADHVCSMNLSVGEAWRLIITKKRTTPLGRHMMHGQRPACILE